MNTIEKLKNLKEIICSDQEESQTSCKEFVELLSGLKKEYYSNVFFSANVGDEIIIIKDLRITNGKLLFNMNLLGDSLHTKIGEFGTVKSITEATVRNVTAAIEGAATLEEQRERRKAEQRNIEEELEAAEKRKNKKDSL